MTEGVFPEVLVMVVAQRGRAPLRQRRSNATSQLDIPAEAGTTNIGNTNSAQNETS